MKKRNYFTGSVFQFYVPEISKYCFCKFFDFRNISEFHGLLAQVFDKFSDKEDNSIDDLKNSDPLFGHRSMHRWPNLRTETGWKYLGVLSNKQDDEIPDFKSNVAAGTKEMDFENGRWHAIKGLVKHEECKFDQVKHLERMTLTTSSLGLVWRTGMEYCRNNDFLIEKFYHIHEDGIKNTYHQMLNVPVYNSIPLEYRGKMIP